MSFVSGLDLGQTHDFSALAVLEKDDAPEPVYKLRHLERYQLGTSYVEIVSKVTALFCRDPLTGSILAVDQTGVGKAVVDLLRANHNPPWILRPITITGGHKVGESDDRFRTKTVPKKDLVGCAQILFQAGRLKLAKRLPETAILVKELENFRSKITLSANEILEAWRDGDHDDLVLALALACWQGENGGWAGPWQITTSRDYGRDIWDKIPGGVFLSPGNNEPERNRGFK
jgi:hypothetical protein